MSGITRGIRWTQQELQKANHSISATQLFSHFFEKAFVSRVKRRMAIRIERL